MLLANALNIHWTGTATSGDDDHRVLERSVVLQKTFGSATSRDQTTVVFTLDGSQPGGVILTAPVVYWLYVGCGLNRTRIKYMWVLNRLLFIM